MMNLNMLRYSSTHDEIAIKKLFAVVFKDTPDFYDPFVKMMHHHNALLYDDDDIVAMAFVLPASISINRDIIPAAYLYACATMPSYRKQGIMSAMIQKIASDYFAKGGRALFLKPATPQLYQFYQSLGFKSCFAYNFHNWVKPATQEPTFHTSTSLQWISAVDYSHLRLEKLKYDFAVHWNTTHFQLVEQITPNSHFFIFRNLDDVIGIGFLQIVDNQLIVNEYISQDSQIDLLLVHLCDTFQVNKIRIITFGEQIPNGMILFDNELFVKDNISGYLNFTLD